MRNPDKSPLKCQDFLINSAGHTLDEFYTYFHKMYPDAGTARPIRSTVASCRKDVDEETSRRTVDLLDHSLSMDEKK